ncbi:MAG: hypothetical protein RR942_05570 [Romboutsia sp.]
MKKVVIISATVVIIIIALVVVLTMEKHLDEEKNKTEYIGAKIHDFEEYNQSYIDEFTQNNYVEYENGNLIKIDKNKSKEYICLNKSYYKTKIYEAQRMTAAMESYSAADTILNEMWGELKNIVTTGEFEILRVGQINWIKDKENISDMQIKSRMTIERCNYLLNTYYK